MKQAKVYVAEAKGTFTYIKAFKKENAIKAFKEIDSSVKSKNVKVSSAVNSHQSPVDEDLFYNH